MNHWLVKSEPETWSWDQQVAAGTTEWDGVRNAQAQNNMKQMRKGDRVLFYHSGKQKAVVGIAKVARAAYPDPADGTGKYVLVDLKAVEPLAEPVTLKAIKGEAKLGHLALVRQPRLSVMEVDEPAYKRICGMGGVKG
ncbi:MAG: EVE domain-containing protein [Phycisphaeraceae bacterium]